jgi:LacI family transcriptional regulator
MALVTSGAGRPGDNAFLDGISAALTAAEMPHNALVIRLVSHDFSAFRAQVHELLDRPDRPTGVIVGGARLIGAVVSAAQDLELLIPRDVEVVFQGSGTTGVEEQLPYPHSQPKMTFREIAETVGDALERLAEGEVLTNYRTVIPVVLHGVDQ